MAGEGRVKLVRRSEGGGRLAAVSAGVCAAGCSVCCCWRCVGAVEADDNLSLRLSSRSVSFHAWPLYAWPL